MQQAPEAVKAPGPHHQVSDERDGINHWASWACLTPLHQRERSRGVTFPGTVGGGPGKGCSTAEVQVTLGTL